MILSNKFQKVSSNELDDTYFEVDYAEGEKEKNLNTEKYLKEIKKKQL